jgi:hypothetical protein
LRATSKSQGVYALWLASDPPVCLKVGMAGLRKGKGLRDRLSYHFRSDTINTVLAEHLAADLTSAWARDRNFKDRNHRQRFLAEECYFQVLPLPNLSEEEIRSFEAFLEHRLAPRYAGPVRE